MSPFPYRMPFTLGAETPATDDALAVVRGMLVEIEADLIKLERQAAALRIIIGNLEGASDA
jgi:hypothetical protein